MLITPTTKTVTEYALTLSEADAAECVASPYVFVDRLVDQLRAAGAVPASNGNGHHKPGKDHPLGFKVQTRKAKAAKAGKAGRPNGEKGGPSLERLQCPHCPRKIARKFMPNHLATKHADLATVSAATSATTN